eukprot:10124602-Lingulodinium_polyedra.AAC.1
MAMEGGDEPLSHEGRVTLQTRGDGTQFVRHSVTMETAELEREKKWQLNFEGGDAFISASDGSETAWFRDKCSRYDCAEAANGQIYITDFETGE